MYRLNLLGGLTLEGAGGPLHGAATQRRPLALLALLATGGERGVPRDRVLLYLWPDSDSRRARSSLNQTLYALRRDLGNAQIALGTGTLRLNPELVTCDLWDFEVALAAGDLDRAAGLYAGPFLEGFWLPDLPEFQEWLEDQRSRLARQYQDTLEALARKAEEAGDRPRALRAWRRLAELDPLGSGPALGIMRTLARAGHRASALAFAREYEERLGRELGTAPDPAVTSLVEELRRSSPPPVRPSAAAAAAVEPPAAAISPEPATHQPSAPTPEIRQARRQRFRLSAAGGLLLVLTAVGLLWLDGSRRPAPGGRPSTLVAVFPFQVSGAPEAQYLGTGLVDLLSANLDVPGEIRSVDPGTLTRAVGRESDLTPARARELAARLGATHYVLGQVFESGGRLRILAALYEHGGGEAPLARVTVEGESAQLFTLVNQLTSQLLTERYRGPPGRLARVAATATESLPALTSYLNGERELRAGRYAPAADAFQQAVRLDSTFALAYYRLSIAASWVGQDSLAAAAAAHAQRHAARLSEHDRLLVEALVAARSGDAVEAERLYRQITDDYPDDVEAWFQLGELLFHTNPLRGRSATLAGDAFERALALDPEDEEALVYLARIAAIEGRRRRVDSLMNRLLALRPHPFALELRAFRAFALGDREAHKRVTRELLRQPSAVPQVTALQVAVYLDDIEGAIRFAEELRDAAYSRDVRGLGHRLLARLALARGQWRAAEAQLDTALQFDSVAVLELRSLLASYPFVPLSRERLLAIRGQVEAWRPPAAEPPEATHSAAHARLHRLIRLHTLGMLSARLGDYGAARRYAGLLEQAADSANEEVIRAMARSVSARGALENGNVSEGLRLLDPSRWAAGGSAFEREALDRYLRAELLYAAGMDEEALAWYGAMAQRAAYELVFLAPAHLRQGQLLERLARPEQAGSHYRAFIRLWQDADPEFQPRVAEARRRVAGLGSAVRPPQSPSETHLTGFRSPPAPRSVPTACPERLAHRMSGAPGVLAPRARAGAQIGRLPLRLGPTTPAKPTSSCS